jgi:hypothetical protein
MRSLLILIPVALAAVVALAQDAAKTDELIERLGNEDYAVREEATKALIEMGDEAIPALEKALESEDLEVRLRAGRALREIRGMGETRKKIEEKEVVERSAGASSTRRGDSFELQMSNGKVRLRRTEYLDGEKKVTEYEAGSLEELKKKHPELEGFLGRFRMEVTPFQGPKKPRQDGFDMDRFWEDWSKEFNDDFWNRWHQDLRRDAERMRRLAERWDEERERWLERPSRPQRQPAPAGRILGVRASEPDPVLDSQLQLRGAGIVIEAVERDTVADTLGLRRYDILVELNGVAIRGLGDVSRALLSTAEGKPHNAKVIRKGQPTRLP